MSTPEAAVLQNDIGADRAEAAARQAALDTEHKTQGMGGSAAAAELPPMEAGVSKQIDALSALKPPKPEALPEWKPQPLVDSKDYQQLSLGLIGMALIGGIASRGNWMGVSSSLNGALKGYYDGNKDAADRRYQDYKTQFDAAMAKNKEQQKEFEDILQNKRLSINDMLAQIKIASAKYGRDDVRMEAEQKSIDGIWKRVETMDATLARLADQDQRQRYGLDAMMARDKQRLEGASGDLDDYGHWMVNQTLAAGNPKLEQMVQSRFGAHAAAQALNTVGKQYHDEGLDPREFTAGQVMQAVEKTAATQANNRLLAIGRLTSSIQGVEPEIQRLVTKVNGNGMTMTNATFNAISSQFGDEDLSELKTLLKAIGTQYIEAETMPGSNAQLHATSSEWAAGNFDPNMNLANLSGVFKAMNLSIPIMHKALQDQVNTARSAISTQGPTLPVPGAPPAAPPAHQPFSDPAKEQRYQEWKASQGNAPAQ